MDLNILKNLQYKAFKFFQDYTNFEIDSKGYGLTVDHSERPEVASIAATGFMLSSLVIGVKENYISHEEAKEKVIKTLTTLHEQVSHQFGFFAHFLDIHTGKRHLQCEYSTIDTILALCGVLTVDSFFKDETISSLTQLITQRIDWDAFIFTKDDKTMFKMAYNPDKNGSYVKDKPGFIHQWDMFAEQLPMYIIYAGLHNNEVLARNLYQGFDRLKLTYEDITFICSPHNTLFVYHFPLAWLNLKDYVDEEGISWFNNAKKAIISHQLSALKYQKEYPGFSKYFFGCNASDTPKGYRVYGSLPNISQKMDTDGTIASFSLIGSLPFIPDIIYESIRLMKQIPHLEGTYGFYDAFNMSKDTLWISKRYISIDKGLELLMLDAFLNQHVYDEFMNHPIIQKGLSVLKFKRV